MVSLALALALSPAAAFAQAEAPPPGPPGTALGSPPTAAQQALMRQVHAQAEAARLQARQRLLAALTPAHRTAVANVVGQLALAANPDPRAAAQALDAVLAPAEKQSIVNIDAAQRANVHALMQQAHAAFESTLTPDERAQMAAREAQMESRRQSRQRPAGASDPGAIVLHTLADFGGRGMMHGRPF